ncbi:MAG: hypothetical protein RL260_3579 [Pseudomonadota bacterium]|jgi:hypothetical protein
MKTTLDIDSDLLRQAKAAAALEGTSLTRLIEEGLSLRLRAASSRAASPVRPVPVFTRGGGGLRPGIDPCSNRSLLDAADADTDLDAHDDPLDRHA